MFRIVSVYIYLYITCFASIHKFIYKSRVLMNVQKFPGFLRMAEILAHVSLCAKDDES